MRYMNKNIINTIFILGVTIIVGIEALCLWGVPALLNTAIKNQAIQSIIEKTTGLTSEIKDFNCKTTPDLNLTIKTNNFTLKHENDTVFKIENLKIKLNLPSLLIKKLSIKTIETKSIFTKISRKKNNDFYIGSYKLNLSKNNNKHIKIEKTNILKSEIIINDEIIQQKHIIKINDTNFVYIKNKILTLKTKAKLEKTNTNFSEIYSDFSINLKTNSCTQAKCLIKIQNLDIKNYKEYIKEKYNNEIINASGKINAEIINIEKNKYKINSQIINPQIITKDQFNSIKYPSNIYTNIIVGFKEKVMQIEPSFIKSKDWEIGIEGEIKKHLSQKHQNNLKIKLSNANINSLYWLVPTIANDPMDTIKKIKKYGFGGIANGEITLNGKYQKPEILGNLKITDCYISKNDPLIPNFDANIEFLKDKAQINTKIFTSTKEYVEVKGITELKPFAKGAFNIESTQNVDLAIASYMLIPLHEIVGFDIGPIPYMKLIGTGNIKLKTKGTVIDGNAYGQFNFKDTTATLEGLNTKLENAEGHLKFDGRNLYFTTNNANIQNNKIKIEGNANLDGNINLNVIANETNISTLFNILKTSYILEKQKRLTNNISHINGKTDAFITIKGNAKDYGEILKENTLDISGKLALTNCTATVQTMPFLAQNLTGTIDFKDINWNADLKGKIEKSKFSLIGKKLNNQADIKIIAPEIKTDEIIPVVLHTTKNKALPKTNSFISLIAEYSGDFENIDLNNLKAKGQIKTNNKEKAEIKILSGMYELANGNLQVKNFKANFFDSPVLTDFKITKLFSSSYKINGYLKVSNFDISQLVNLNKFKILPPYIENLINTYENYEGKADIDITCVNNQLKGILSLKDIKFNHKYFKTPIKVDSGSIILDGQKATLNSIIANIDDTPIFLNLSIWDLDKNAKLNGYLTSKINENFINKYVNSKLTSPIKIKGDITITSDIKGSLTNLKLYPKIKFAKDSDLYYKGSNLGNEENEREIQGVIEVLEDNNYLIKALNYTRYMTSQNAKSYPIAIITSNGKIKLEKNKVFIKDFNLETHNKANAKLLNILFEKSIIKSGLFTCNVNIKNTDKIPEIRGYINLENIDIPLYQIFVQKFALDFKDKNTNLDTNGMMLNSDFTAKAIINNEIKKPILIKNIELQSQQTNLNKLIDYITQIPTPNNLKFVDKTATTQTQLNVSDIRIQKGILNVNDIAIKDINATNFKTEFNLDDKMILQIPNLEFNVTTGNVKGTALYEFESGKIKTNLIANNVDSNKIASSLFEFKEQIFGKANGNITITTKGDTEEERLKNMIGYAYFEITDGNMPKLGSIEYLLSAGNLLKSGITGLSLNKIIEVLSPLKTGVFKSIKGSFDIKNGIAQNIEVYSKSDNLNLFINGEYDILQQYANMRVYGRLTQKANNILGKIGNLSINSIITQIPGLKSNENESILKDLNKVPGIELNDMNQRNFTVKIDGVINSDKYVKNFRWIE